MQAIPVAFDLARDNAGSSMPAKIAMMAITTNNSISVKPRRAWTCRQIFMLLGQSCVWNLFSLRPKAPEGKPEI
jgi:hypothetical protein